MKSSAQIVFVKYVNKNKLTDVSIRKPNILLLTNNYNFFVILNICIKKTFIYLFDDILKGINKLFNHLQTRIKLLDPKAVCPVFLTPCNFKKCIIRR